MGKKNKHYHWILRLMCASILMACGGVNAENACTYLKAGANLLSFGASIFNVKLMTEGKWDEIAVNLKKLLATIKSGI